MRYRLSYAEVSEWLAERGVLVDQSTVYRWVQRFLPLFGEVARKYRDPVGPVWRIDETYARIRGRWHYIYRAMDRCGQIVDAYVSPTRDTVAARRSFERAIASSGTRPRRVITDKAATYPPPLRVAVPGVLQRTGRNRTNGIERDRGFLKERLRRGLKSVASPAIFMCGHALMRNIGHRFIGSLSQFRSGCSLPGRGTGWPRLCEPPDRLKWRLGSKSAITASFVTPLRCKRTVVSAVAAVALNIVGAVAHTRWRHRERPQGLDAAVLSVLETGQFTIDEVRMRISPNLTPGDVQACVRRLVRHRLVVAGGWPGAYKLASRRT